MRKHVAPVLAQASIPDPERGGFLPPEGRAVSWTPYWAGMAAREEITVAEAPDEPAAAAEASLPTADAHEAHPDA
ncbi:DUF2635 domain-containing protein [Methylobacterium sp. E-066]|uniref:DUF2635 domain-containing protein n=1 Tax=Methylobacterium sp. E-066 TaxID=2836584 RepID=UPI001FBB1306|nr:DUF2635 domain-containing protein [Methylobacterium sp. E-066]MCJ2143735.1 DUF2635 domain-containing protein [Methylobacterium sp. E-066]